LHDFYEITDFGVICEAYNFEAERNRDKGLSGYLKNKKTPDVKSQFGLRLSGPATYRGIIFAYYQNSGLL